MESNSKDFYTTCWWKWKDDEGYDKIKALVEEAGKSGIVTGGGLKAYFYAKISKRPGEQSFISIDLKELPPSQAW